MEAQNQPFAFKTAVPGLNIATTEPAVPAEFKEKYGEKIYEGLPYRGKIYDRKSDDPISRQPVLCQTIHIDNFNTAAEGDLKRWQDIMQKVADKVALVSFEEKVYDDKIGAWRVLLRWIELFYTNPDGV